MRHLQFQDHAGDDDGDYAITEGLKPAFSYAGKRYGRL
jgi:hypothetical protein